MKQKRLTILTKAEMNTLYGVPLFTDNDRCNYFSLNDAETEAMGALSVGTTKLYFVLQLGYFKATSLFFPDVLSSNKEDVRFIRDNVLGNAAVAKTPAQKTRLAIHTTILNLTGFQGSKAQITNSLAAMLNDRVKVNSSPVYLFHEALSLLQDKKMMLPGYSTLQDLISDAINNEQCRLCGILDNNLTNYAKTAIINVRR